MITLGALNDIAGIRHGFFTREGGVSEGIYASLNCGLGSGDDEAAVRENRARAVATLDGEVAALVTCYQTHSPDVIRVTTPWEEGDRPKADALVTDRPGLALGILTADCAPVLLADARAGVVGAAHAGWKGALTGVVEATIEAMEALGARRSRMAAGIGPRIGLRSYEVGPEFRDRFLEQARENDELFSRSCREGHFMFDLGGYLARRLELAGIGAVSLAPNDTASETDRFFSYRRARQRGEADYGRLLSAIAIEG